MCIGGGVKPAGQDPAPADQGAAALKLGTAADGPDSGIGRLMLRLGNSATGAPPTNQIVQSPTV